MPNQLKWKKTKGSWYTRSLFADVMSNTPKTSWYEDAGDVVARATYWLNERKDPKDKRLVLKDLFLKTRDPTGMKLATEHLGGWEHLQVLLQCTWFKKAWDKWQDELFFLLQSAALERIQEIMTEGSAQSLNAAKYIAGKEWEDKTDTPKRGRPSKDEIKGELKKQVRQLTQSEEDYKRMTGNILQFKGKQN